jgi:hypothetical protein
MSTLGTSLQALTERFPSEKAAISRLRSLVEGGRHEFDSKSLYDLLDPSSMFLLDQVIEELLNAGVFASKVRIISPTIHGGVGVADDVETLADAPLLAYDRDGSEFVVTPDLLKIIYTVTE